MMLSSLLRNTTRNIRVSNEISFYEGEQVNLEFTTLKDYKKTHHTKEK